MGQREHSLAIQEKMAEIKKLRQQQDLLHIQLEHSLALQELWPEAFAHGPIKVRFEGGQTHFRMVIIDGNGTEKTFQLTDVPTILWYKQLRKMHETSHISNWPKALREEFRRRRAAAKAPSAYEKWANG